MWNNVILEKDNGVAVLTMNRPAQMNAINEALLLELKEAIQQIAADEDVRVVVVTGAGEKAFVAGADIAAMSVKNQIDSKAFSEFGQGIFSMLERLPQPVIAMIQGVAFGGGCELAMACDIRIASEKARFSQPEVGLGITAGFGGSQRLPRLVGRGKASLIMFSGRIIDAPTALAMGLVDQVVPVDELRQTVMTLAKTIAEQDPFAVRQTKQCIRHGLECGLEAGLSYEAQASSMCFASDIPKTLMTSFMNKKK